MTRLYIIAGIILVISSILHILFIRNKEHFENEKEGKKSPEQMGEKAYSELRGLKDRAEKEYLEAVLSWRESKQQPTDKTKNILVTMPKLVNESQAKANTIHKNVPNSPLAIEGQNIANEIAEFNNKTLQFTMRA